MFDEISSLLTQTSDVCGGRLRINGTRLTVNQIVTWYKQGYNPEEITELYPHLTLAQVYTALAYYHTQKDKIENDILAEEKEADMHERQYMPTGDTCHDNSVVCR